MEDLLGSLTTDLELAGIDSGIVDLGGGLQGVRVDHDGDDRFLLVTLNDGPWLAGLYASDEDEVGVMVVPDWNDADATDDNVHRMAEWILTLIIRIGFQVAQ